MTETEQKFLFGVPLTALPTYKIDPPVGDVPVNPRDGIDYDLLDRVLDYIKAHPGEWKQDDWYQIVNRETGRSTYISEETTLKEVNSCGTAFCFAGHAAIAAGFPGPPVPDYKTMTLEQIENFDDSWQRKVTYSDGGYDYETVSEFATVRLGLQYGQADVLFAGVNEIKALEFYVALLHAFPKMPGYVMKETWYNKENLVDDFINLAMKYGPGGTYQDSW